MNKKAEIDRLRAIVFDGAPSNYDFAAMNSDGLWHFFGGVPPKATEYGWWLGTRFGLYRPKNQPETDLDWTETLISRGE